jgi:hypothetical protein
MALTLTYTTMSGGLFPSGAASIDQFTPITVHTDVAHNNPHAKLLKNDNDIASYVNGLEAAVAAVAASVVFTKSYNSGDQQIITNGTLTLAHGLGMLPKAIFYYLHCITADNGFSPGEYLDANNFTYSAGGGTTSGLSNVFDATNLTIYYANIVWVFIGIHKTGRYGANLTNASWRLVVNAFA